MRKRVLVTGGTGFLGQHVTRAFHYTGWEVIPLGQKDGDLRDPITIRALLALYQPEAVIHLAATCGGIGANQRLPATYFADNALMGIHVIQECCKVPNVRLVVAGSICSYPLVPPRIPFVEEDLHAGFPEPTNAAYGVVKRDLAVLLAAARRQHGLDGCMLMPTNLFGPGDCFDPERSHVIPALIRKVLEAKEKGAPTITLWGSGSATRDFLDARDAARAFVLAAEKQRVQGPFNLGSGCEISIRTLADTVCQLCEWKGTILWDKSKPDGQPRRVLDSSKALTQLGWQARIPFHEGLRACIEFWQGKSA